MTPEEAISVLQNKPRKKRKSMWAMTDDNGFIFGNSPFNNENPFGL